MSWKSFLHRRFSTLTQFFVLLAFVLVVVIAYDVTRRAQAGRLVGVGEEALQTELDIELTRQVELQVTLAYVQSDEYVAIYAREEGGLLLPDEKRIVPLTVQGTPQPTPIAEPTPDPAQHAHPWQAWWQLLTDAPMPSR